MVFYIKKTHLNFDYLVLFHIILFLYYILFYNILFYIHYSCCSSREGLVKPSSAEVHQVYLQGVVQLPISNPSLLLWHHILFSRPKPN